MTPTYASWQDGHKKIRPWAEYARRLRQVPKRARFLPFTGFLLCLIYTFAMAVAIPWIFPAFVLASFFYLRYLRPWRTAMAPFRAADDEISTLVTEPSCTTHHPVDLAVFDGTTLIGEDSGMVTTVDGWLLFHGLRCTFSIKNQDVKGVTFPPVVAVTHLGIQKYSHYPTSLLLNAAPRERRIALWPRNTPTDYSLEDLVTDLQRWTDGPCPEGKSVFPPTNPHPITAYHRWLRFWAGFIYLPLVALVFFFTVIDPTNLDWRPWTVLAVVSLAVMAATGVLRSAFYAMKVSASRACSHQETSSLELPTESILDLDSEFPETSQEAPIRASTRV